MDLSFLSNVKLEPVKKAAPVVKTATPKLPVDADLRLFANGRCYPSEKFAAEHSLEFTPRVTETVTKGDGTLKNVTVVGGNGLDIFSSKKWGMIMGKLPMELIFAAVTPKDAPKVDLFASTKYEEDGTPKSSVFTQGVSVFSKEVLVPMVTEIYGVNWDFVDYVDLTFVTAQPIFSENGVYHLPKIVSAGSLKGEDTYIRRENLTICPLVITHTEYSKDPKTATEGVVDNSEQVAITDAATLDTSTDDAVTQDSIDNRKEAVAQWDSPDSPAVSENPFLKTANAIPDTGEVNNTDTVQFTDPGDNWAAGLGSVKTAEDTSNE